MQVEWYVTAGCEGTACRWTGMLQLGVRATNDRSETLCPVALVNRKYYLKVGAYFYEHEHLTEIKYYMDI